MKRRSGTSNLPPSLPDPSFFTDRDLGKQFPALLREAGLTVVTYFDVYPGEDEIADNVWLRKAATEEWVALTKDKNIKRDAEAIRTICLYSGRVFIMRGAIAHRELAALFLAAKASVLRILKRTPGPFVGTVYRQLAKGGLPRPKAAVWRKHGGLCPDWPEEH